MQWLWRRLQHLHRAFFTRLWAWIWVGPVGFVSGVAWLRDEVGSAAFSSKYKAVNYLPHWSSGWWVAAWLAVFWVILFEGSYRQARKLQSEIDAGLLQIDAYHRMFTNDWGDLPLVQVLERIAGSRSYDACKVAGRALEDRLRAGQVRSWARRGGIDKGPLTPIEPATWSLLELDYFVLDEDEDPKVPCASGRPGITAQALFDLRFNSHQIAAIWPTPIAMT
jgi:hypothetical protein